MSFIDSALAIAEPITEAQGVKVTIKNVSAELSKCFFHPEDEDDLTEISNNLHPWLIQAYKELNGGSINKAIEIATGILDEIGSRYETDEYYCCFDDYCPTDEDCLNAAYIITQIMQTANTKQSSQQKVMTALKAISKHRSFNDYGYFDIDTFVKNYGMYLCRNSRSH